MRIVAMCHALDWTGAPLALLRLLTALRARGHDVLLVAAGGAENSAPLIRAYLDAGIAVDDGIDLKRADVVLLNTLLCADYLGRARRWPPAVLWVHEPAFGLRFVEQGKVRLDAFDKAERVVFPTRWQADTLYRHLIDHDRVDVVPSGLPEPDAARVPIDTTAGRPLTLVQIGALEHRKGPDIALHALSRLPKDAVRLVLVGAPGPGRFGEQVAGRIAALKAAGWDILAAGRLPNADAMAWIDRADLVLAPTRDDLLSLSILEGMARGRAPATTALPPMVEGLRDGIDAVLIDPEHFGSLADRLLPLIADRERLAALGAAARATFERRHTIAAHVAAMEAVLQRAAAAGRSRT